MPRHAEEARGGSLAGRWHDSGHSPSRSRPQARRAGPQRGGVFATHFCRETGAARPRTVGGGVAFTAAGESAAVLRPVRQPRALVDRARRRRHGSCLFGGLGRGNRDAGVTEKRSRSDLETETCECKDREGDRPSALALARDHFHFSLSAPPSHVAAPRGLRARTLAASASS